MLFIDILLTSFLETGQQTRKNLTAENILQHFFGVIIHDRVVEVESLEVEKGRSDDALWHGWLELDAEVHQLPFEENQQLKK